MSADLSHSPATPLDAGLEEFLNTLPDGVIVIGRDWRILYANAVACAISRIQPEFINSRPLHELFPGIEGTVFAAAYERVMEQRVEQSLEPYFYEPFQHWVSVRVVPISLGIALHYRDVTEQVVSAAARKTTDDLLHQVLDATAEGVLTIDRKWCVTYVNRQAAKIIAPGGDILGRHFWEFFPDAVYEGSPYVQHYYGAMEHDRAATFGAFYPEPLNIWVDVTVRPAPDGIVIFFRDITEQKTREDALRASEERYRVLAELNPQSLWSAGPDGLVTYANQRFLEYIGKDFVPVTGEEYIQCFDPEDRARVIEVWTHSVITGEDYSIRARLLRASDGASRWWHVWALPVRDADGAIQQWLGLATDIHDEHVAQNQLRAQFAEIDHRRREAETIYHSSPIGMALYEPRELRLTRINQQQANIFGVSADEAIGKRFDELAAGVDQTSDMIRRAAAGETVLNQDVDGVLASRPGEHRYWNVNYSPIFADDGTVQAIASATIETTRQKLAEAALIQSEKLAAVGRMASSIAHEINNPLESVTNLLFLARSHATDPDSQTFLNLADQELRRVSMITNQTLRFHKQASRPREISAADLFSTVLSLYEGRLKNSNILVDHRRLSTRRISCFEGDIRQVLNNLVGNAIDAMPTGGRLVLRSRESTDWSRKTGLARRGLTLTVADNGSGIPLATQARIFEAFFTTKGIAGTGLGLWISTEIMDRHNGCLRLRSSQAPAHRGTVFTLFLPFDSAPQPAV